MSFIVIIPISRVFVNVHYPSDVIAGISLGYVLLTLSRFFFLDLHLFFKRSSS
ncbi:phosphatase PAP2 family protein [Leuconostoc litchii]|nr:phosphatase PAP2 family protein [Leuconostoc litchii]